MKVTKMISDALLQARSIRNVVQAQQESHPNSFLLDLVKDQYEALLRIEGAFMAAMEFMDPNLTTEEEGSEAPETTLDEHFMSLPSRDEKTHIEV